MAGQVPELTPPLTFTLIAGGRSNLTYRVEDAAGRTWALRRPPLHHVLPTAHDMGREYRLMHSLGPAGIPVPVTVGLCTDESVNERPFYVMEFVEGHILRTAAEAEKAFDETTRRGVGDRMADTLASLHDVEPDTVGLGDLGRHEGYIERQLKRWRGQYDQMQVEGVESDRDGLVTRVSDELARRIPAQQRTSVVHGDYRMDNVVLRDDGSVRAILDWEICTLGDPLADLGVLMVYWAEPNDAMAVLGGSPTTAAGFSTRAQVLDHYGVGVGARPVRESATTWRSATGSSPASSRASSPGTWREQERATGAAWRGFPSRSAASSRLAAESLENGGREPRGSDRDLRGPPRAGARTGPVLVVSLEGWVDAGLGATTAVAALLGQCRPSRWSPSTASTSWTSGPGGRWPAS